jgi:hypothetical protein
LIFTQASKRGADRIGEILDIYNRGSGQLVNKSKSTIFFSENCGQEVKEEVHESLQIPTEALGEKYLGLLTGDNVGSATEGTFDYLADRIRNFAHGWGGQLLSCAGCGVPIKANAQAVPTHPMSCLGSRLLLVRR